MTHALLLDSLFVQRIILQVQFPDYANYESAHDVGLVFDFQRVRFFEENYEGNDVIFWQTLTTVFKPVFRAFRLGSFRFIPFVFSPGPELISSSNYKETKLINVESEP